MWISFTLSHKSLEDFFTTWGFPRSVCAWVVLSYKSFPPAVEFIITSELFINELDFLCTQDNLQSHQSLQCSWELHTNCANAP